MKLDLSSGLVLGGMTLLLLGTFPGCTDTDRASLSAYGTSGSVQCYSGGKLFYEGKSTGRIQNAAHSDGYEFKDAATGKLVRVNGDCLVQN